MIRGLDDGVHAALVKRARENGRGLEAQLRVICGAAALFEGRVLAFDTRAVRSFGEIMLEAKRCKVSISRANGMVAAVARS